MREFDIVIFGATGFTGARVALEVAAKAQQAKGGRAIKVAVAGRDEAKLRALAAQLPGGASGVGVIGGVDIKDEGSVARMAAAGRVLLNCVGPYRFYGEPVFRAAAAAGTDYLDLCGEPEFIERMELEVNGTAKESGALMACASAFDSIPNDLGTVLAARALAAAGAAPARVDSVIQISAPKGLPINFATWESAVHGIGSAAHLADVRRRAKAAPGARAAPKLLGPRPKLPAGPVWDRRVRAYTLPFPGADASIVKRTQAALSAAGEPAVHFSARFGVPSAYYAAVAVVVGATMMALAKHSWGRGLLLKHAGLMSYGLVSHTGPTQEQMDSAATTVTLVARGYTSPPPPPPAAAGAATGAAAAAPAPPAPEPDKRAVLRIKFGDPGYVYTGKMMAAAALALLEERARVLESVGGHGGVFTAGFLLRDTTLKERLEAEGMVFEVTVDDNGDDDGVATAV